MSSLTVPEPTPSVEHATEPASPILDVRGMWKEYGKQVVLEQISTSVQPGEFVTLVGASGCGKTTFLKMLLGTESPTRGSILMNGVPIANEPGEDRGIVFQKYSVFPHLTAVQNVMLSRELEHSRLFGKLFGSARRLAHEQAEQMLEAVGLSHALDKYPHQLSGGMQQRLAIAQSLMKTPKILLLDEPFGALDPGIRADMHELVRKLWQEQGLTIFMITHDLKEAFTLGTRLWVFDKPRVDPHAPEAFGARITYDIPINRQSQQELADLSVSLKQTGT